MQIQTVLRLPAEPIAPALARAGIRGVTPDLAPGQAADLALLATEIVANAVRHGAQGPADEIVVRVISNDCIRVEVVDPGPGFAPEPTRPQDARTSGWGLFLLDHIARSWGVEPDREGTMVWFELERAGRAGLHPT